MSAAATLEPQVVTTSEALWFLGTLVQPKLSGEQTGGRFALWEGVLPRGAAPPLHTHPQGRDLLPARGESRRVGSRARGGCRRALDRDARAPLCARRSDLRPRRNAAHLPRRLRHSADALPLDLCRHRGIRLRALRAGPLAVAPA